MNKRAIFILGIIVMFFGAAYITTKIEPQKGENIVADNIEVKESAEQKTEEEVPTVSAAVDEVKVTPNTLLILKKHYKDCDHTIISSAEIPEEMVNMTEEELKEAYSSWEIEKFTKEEVILLRESDSFCGEHYLVTEEEGAVVIYTLDEKGEKSEKEVSDIAYEYLPETDKVILSNGIYVYGKEELNKIREDFES